MRVLWLTATLLAAGLAGCLGDDGGDGDGPVGTPDPTTETGAWRTFLCKGGYRDAAAVFGQVDTCNHRVTKPLLNASTPDWSNQHGPANEVSVAVHPDDPLRVAGGGKDYTVTYLFPDTADCGAYTVWMGTHWSSDGGIHWRNDMMPGFPGDTRPSPLAGNLCNTDPVLVFDDDGTLWYSGLNYVGQREDAATATLPGGASDAVSGSQLYFARSHDAGASYDAITFAGAGDEQFIFNDKQWYAAQPRGDHMVATWSQFYTTPLGGLPTPVGVVPFDGIVYSESLDAGATWTPARPVGVGQSLAVDGQFSMPQYLPDGESADIAVIWLSYAGGVGNPQATRVAYVEGVLGPGGVRFGPALAAFDVAPMKSGPDRDGTGPSSFRVSTYPVLAVDTSGGPFDGRRYVVWADQPGPLDSDVEVLLRHSDDGLAWSEPVAVNDVPAGDQFMPWVDVDPQGGVHVAWYDRRHDPENGLMDVYYAHSEDGGASFAPNIRVSEVSFDGDLGHHQSGAPFIGDYIGLDTTSVSAHIMWADTRHTCDHEPAPDGPSMLEACGAPWIRPGRATGSDVYSATILRGPEARTVFDAAFGSAG